jgi:hypothetical protein
MTADTSPLTALICIRIPYKIPKLSFLHNNVRSLKRNIQGVSKKGDL